MKLNYKPVTYEQYDEIAEFAGKYWDELYFAKEYLIEYKPDRAQFRDLYAAGALMGVAGLTEENEIGSVFLGVKSPFIFNPDLVIGTEIMWSIRKDLRTPKVFSQFVREIDRCTEHVDILQITGHDDRMEKILNRHGYDKRDQWYMKRNN